MRKKIKQQRQLQVDRKTERNRDGERRDEVVGGRREQQISRKTEQRPEGLQVVN